MAYKIALTQRNAAVLAVTNLFDKGARPAVSTLRIYSNATSQPSSPESAVPGGSVLLAQVPLAVDAFADPVTGTGVANSLPLQTPVINSGTAAWFRFYTGEASPAALSDGTVTVTGGGGDMTFDNVTFVSGGTVSIAGLSITIPM
jgi:hypothetical protein